MKITIKHRFWQTPHSLLFNPNATFKAKWLYGYIQAKPDDYDFSSDRISLESKDGRDGIRSGLQELEELWYLKRHKYKNQKGQWQIDYELLVEPEKVSEETEKTRTENPPLINQETRTENPTTENPTTENTATNKKGYTKKDIIKKNNIMPNFEKFWKDYPNKKAKWVAEKSFARLTDTDKEKAMEELPRHIDFWRKKYWTSTAFIPYPATWLNQKRFEDVLTSKDLYDALKLENKKDIVEALKKEEKYREKLKEQNEEDLKAAKIAEEQRKNFILKFRSLPKEKQDHYIEQAEKQLPAAIIKTKNTFPDIYEKIKFAKIKQIVEKEEEKDFIF